MLFSQPPWDLRNEASWRTQHKTQTLLSQVSSGLGWGPLVEGCLVRRCEGQTIRLSSCCYRSVSRGLKKSCPTSRSSLICFLFLGDSLYWVTHNRHFCYSIKLLLYLTSFSVTPHEPVIFVYPVILLWPRCFPFSPTTNVNSAFLVLSTNLLPHFVHESHA